MRLLELNDAATRYPVLAGGVSAAAFLASVFLPWSIPLFVVGSTGLLVMAVQVAWSIVAPRRGVVPFQERRGLDRLDVNFNGTLDWTDSQGEARSVKVKGVDLSRRGAMVESSVPLLRDSVVFVNILSHGLMGVAHVRHCTPRGTVFRIGLEFRSPLMRREMGEWNISYRAAG